MATLIRKAINPKIARLCREQMALKLEDVARIAGIATLEQIEAGEKEPTLNQLEKLAKEYCVPRWVFTMDKLPPEYVFDESVPAFRNFANNQDSPTEFSPKARSIVTKVSQRRKLILTLRDEQSRPIKKFTPPAIAGKSIDQLGSDVREWLGAEKTQSYEFDCWKKFCEDKDIFIFTASNMSDWSYVKDLFRGISIYSEKLPTIIINGSDFHKSQSFTLFHELGHLLRGESRLDENETSDDSQEAEHWCDEFASNLLMPSEVFEPRVKDFPASSSPKEQLVFLDVLAKEFKVSTLACATRLRINESISWPDFNKIRVLLKKRYEESKSFRKGGARRNMVEEGVKKYGRVYLHTLLQAYYDKELTLAKVKRLLDIKSQVDIATLREL